MSELKWTKEAPKESGWYWLAPDLEMYKDFPINLKIPSMVSVYREFGRGEMYFSDGTLSLESYPCAGEGRLWAGPLEPPKYEEEEQ